MWLVFGSGSKRKPIKGGARADGWCAKCSATRTFVECEIEDKVDVFFVSVFEGKSRRLVCTECGEDVELPSTATAPAATSRPAPRAADPPRRELSENEKDKLLAELKKKMSR